MDEIAFVVILVFIIVKWTHKPCKYYVHFYILKWSSISFGNVCLVPSLKCHIISLNVAHIGVYAWVCVYLMQVHCFTIFCRIFVFNFPCVWLFFGCSWSFQQKIVFYRNTDASHFFSVCFVLLSSSYENIQNKRCNDTGTNGVGINASERDQKHFFLSWILFIVMRQCWACVYTVHCLDVCIGWFVEHL